MIRKTLITLVAAGCLIAVTSALLPGSHTPPAVPRDETGYAAHTPRYLKGKLLDGCFEEPAYCGLVVW